MKLRGLSLIKGWALVALALAWPASAVSQDAGATAQEEAQPVPAQSAPDENVDPVRFDSLPPVSYPLDPEEVRRRAFQQEIDEIRRSGKLKEALGVGDKVTDFELPMGNGVDLRLSEMLAAGPVVVTFYRGNWCQHCNRHLQDLQEVLLELHGASAQLVAVGPEVPEQALATQLKNHLAYPVLSDKQNAVGRQFGLVSRISAQAAPYYDALVDFEAQNGDRSYELPLPATYVVGGDGVIRYAFVEADCQQRADPQEILSAVRREAGAPPVAATGSRADAGIAGSQSTNP